MHTTTAGALLEAYRAHGAHFTEAELDRIETLKTHDGPSEDKWTARQAVTRKVGHFRRVPGPDAEE